MLTRNLGSIPLSEVQGDVLDASYFVRVDIASPVGTKRFTDRPNDFTGNIDGGSQTWTAYDLIVGPLNQSAQSSSSVSWVSFANVFDSVLGSVPWTGWSLSPGLRKAKVFVWLAYFNRATGALYDKNKIYEGTVDSGEFGDRATLALAPYLLPWSKQQPSITGMFLGAGPLMPDPQITIRWVDGVGSVVGYRPAPNTSGANNGVPPPYDIFGGIFDTINPNHLHHR